MTTPARRSYDVVVAGSGAGGCAVAGTLAQAGAKVLLVEEGRRAQAPRDALEAVLRYYSHGGFWAPSGNCLMPVPTGRALGGTTTINSGTCFDTPADLVRRWEADSGGRFDAAAFSKHLAEVRRRLPVRRATEATASACSRRFLFGLRALGRGGGHYLERAETGCTGAGRCCFICPEGAKATADRAFLEPGGRGPEIAENTSLRWVRPAPRPGGFVRAGLRTPTGDESVSCRSLVLACGSLATPYFVRSARLGAAWRSAGDGLTVHPAAKLFALFEERIEGWKGVPQGVGWTDSELPGVRFEGVYTPPDLAALTLPLEGRALRDWMDQYDRVATFGLMIRDSGRGSVRYPLGRSFPVIRYDLPPEDAATIAKGLLRAARVFLAAGAKKVLLPFVGKPNVFETPEELERRDPAAVRPGELQLMAFHPLGTCAMGRTADWDQRVAEGVYVSDGSLVPGPLGVNPQLTIYALGLRLAERLAREGLAA